MARWNWRGRRGRVSVAVLIAVLACASTVVAGLGSLPDGGRYAAYMTWRYAGPRGGLAADSAVRDAALRSWDARTGMAPDEKALLANALGPARVVWSGDAAGVRGVVVAQSAYVTPHELPGLDEGVEPRHDVWGYLRVGRDGAATVAAVAAYDLASLPYLRVLGGWLDPAHGIGVVLDLGTPAVVSETVEPTSTGEYGRVSRPLVFRPDGIAVVDVADGIGLQGVAVVGRCRPSGSTERCRSERRRYDPSGRDAVPRVCGRRWLGYRPLVRLDDDERVW